MFGKKTFSSFVWTFAIGAIAGAAAAMLYTPITGKRMQRKVSDITEKVVDRVDDLTSAVRRVANA